MINGSSKQWSDFIWLVRYLIQNPEWVELGGRKHAFLAKGNLMNFNFWAGRSCPAVFQWIFREFPKKSADVWTIGGIDHVVNYEMPLNAEVGTMLGSVIECKGGGLRWRQRNVCRSLLSSSSQPWNSLVNFYSCISRHFNIPYFWIAIKQTVFLVVAVRLC